MVKEWSQYNFWVTGYLKQATLPDPVLWKSNCV